MGALGQWIWSGPRSVIHQDDEEHGDVIARILGARAWASLPAAVQFRFSRVTPALYRGATDTRLSVVGRFFAWSLLPFGAPLPVLTGVREALVEVSVKDGDMSWTRITRGPLGLTFQVRSIKRPSQDGRLLECCAGGWTMLLDVTAEDGVLVFRSRQFYWRLASISVPLPLAATPGAAEVRHADLGHGRFRFTLTFDHPFFGRTVFQDGVFEDPADSCGGAELLRQKNVSHKETKKQSKAGLSLLALRPPNICAPTARDSSSFLRFFVALCETLSPRLSVKKRSSQ